MKRRKVVIQIPRAHFTAQLEAAETEETVETAEIAVVTIINTVKTLTDSKAIVDTAITMAIKRPNVARNNTMNKATIAVTIEDPTTITTAETTTTTTK